MKVKILLIALAVAAVSGCVPVLQSGLPDPKLTERDKQMMARAEPDEWRIPDVRSKVRYSTHEMPGTIVVDTGSRHLYYVLPRGEAIEYRIATGAEAYRWSGRATVGRMKEWPTWMPTTSIMERWPEFRAYIAHGPLAMSMAIGLMSQLNLIDGTAMALLNLSWDFSAPVRIGDTIHARVTPTAKKPTSKPGRGTVTMRFEVINQRHETVQTGTITLLVKARG